jgi:hypothetical protein
VFDTAGLDSVGSLTSYNRIGLHGLLGDSTAMSIQKLVVSKIRGNCTPRKGCCMHSLVSC